MPPDASASAAGHDAPASRWATLAMGAQAIVIAALLWLGIAGLPAPTGHAYAASSWAMVAYAVLHAFIALLCAAFIRARIASGHIRAGRVLEPSVGQLFNDYAGVATWLVLACILAPLVLA